MYLSELQNIFVKIAKCICQNCKMNLSKLQNVFVQINKVVSFAVSGSLLEAQMPLLHPRGLLLQEKKHPIPSNSISSKTKTLFLQRSCLQYLPISYRAVNGCCTGGELYWKYTFGYLANTYYLDIWQILIIWIFGKYLLFGSRNETSDISYL